MRALAAAIWLLLSLGASGFGPPTLGPSDVSTPPLSSVELAALRAIPPLAATVQSVAAVTLDAATGHTLASRNPDARLAPASLTKMMTALVALDRASLSDIIVATSRSRSEPSVIGLDPGDTLSLEHMLYGLLLTSGNDAALAIAETLGGGSIERFVGWMNERAAKMGLVNTRFTNPTGLDQEGHYSSARDMANIARALMATPTLAHIVGTRRYIVEGPPPYFFSTTNPLLGAYPGLDGVKTGFTDAAGPCLAASALRDGRRLVTVVLNSPNIVRDTEALLDTGFATARPTPLAPTRPGFAAVRYQDVAALPARLSPLLAGWELPLLRAFATRDRTTISLLGRPIAWEP